MPVRLGVARASCVTADRENTLISIAAQGSRRMVHSAGFFPQGLSNQCCLEGPLPTISESPEARPIVDAQLHNTGEFVKRAPRNTVIDSSRHQREYRGVRVGRVRSYLDA